MVFHLVWCLLEIGEIKPNRKFVWISIVLDDLWQLLLHRLFHEVTHGELNYIVIVLFFHRALLLYTCVEGLEGGQVEPDCLFLIFGWW